LINNQEIAFYFRFTKTKKREKTSNKRWGFAFPTDITFDDRWFSVVWQRSNDIYLDEQEFNNINGYSISAVNGFVCFM